MGHFLKEAADKYKKISVEMKATAWYTVGNVVQKIAPWLVMIILTHYLPKDQYGVYTIFMSWLEIFEIIITLRVYSNGYVAGLVREDEKRALYTATVQTLSFILIGVWLVLYLIFHKPLNAATGIDTTLTVVMIASFMGTVSFGLWSARQRVDNQYKQILVAIIFYGMIGPVVGALSIFLNLENPVFYVIVIRTAIQLTIAIPFFISNYKGTKKIWDKNMAVETLKYNLPLIPYYLSMVLLNHSDRLMVKEIQGYEAAALYSVAYSAAMVIFVVSGALNSSLQAWMFKELKKGTPDKEDKSRLITIGAILVAICAIGEIILAPEVILVFGGRKYLEAIWVVPPLAISVVVMYIYQQYVNVLFYYKRTGVILFASVFAAVMNIFLNAIFIPKFGYVAGGYTSLASYVMVWILYYIFAWKECRRNNITMQCFFKSKLQVLIFVGLMAISGLMMLVYRQMIVRYAIIAGMLIILLCTHKKWIGVLKTRYKQSKE